MLIRTQTNNTGPLGQLSTHGRYRKTLSHRRLQQATQGGGGLSANYRTIFQGCTWFYKPHLADNGRLGQRVPGTYENDIEHNKSQ